MELFAIGQGLPGPTSTQLVVSVATSRAGMLGGLLALFMWNLPGLIVCTVASVAAKEFIDPEDPPFWLVGFAPAAIALLFQAAYGFCGKLDNTLGKPMALVSCVVAVIVAGDENIDKSECQWVYPVLLVCGSFFTYLDSKRSSPIGSYAKPQVGWDATSDETMSRIGIPIALGVIFFVVWLVILAGCVYIRRTEGLESGPFALFECMYRVGSIIFGGGQVVLPMLYTEVVDTGWITDSTFYQGFALAQSLPGPLFNFAPFVGGSYLGVPGALIAYLGLFSPGVVLIFAIMPFWATLRHVAWFKAALVGLNNTAMGFIFAACILMWESAIGNAAAAATFMVTGVFALKKTGGKFSAPLSIIVGGAVGAALHLAGLGQKPY